MASEGSAAAAPPQSRAQPFSLSLGSKSKALGGATAAKRKRPHSALADQVESDEEDEGRVQPLAVTGFDSSTGGAISARQATPEKAPLIISSQKNRDWRKESERKRRKNLLPPEEQAKQQSLAAGNAGNGVPEVEAQKVYGLVVKEAIASDGASTTGLAAQGAAVQAAEEKPKTVDEEALERLLHEDKRKSSLVISNFNAPDERFTIRTNDGDSFKADVASRPEPASLEEYSRVPIEDFGAALLRGMGWREGDAVGKKKSLRIKPRIVGKRASRLGIGATKAPEGIEEIGAWGRGAKQSGKPPVLFNPIVMKNRRTGEMITEEEFNRQKPAPPSEQREEIQSAPVRERDREREQDTKHSLGHSARDRHGDDRQRRHQDSERKERRRRDDEYDDYERKKARRKGHDDERDQGSARRSDHRQRERARDHDVKDKSRSRRHRSRSTERTNGNAGSRKYR